MYNNGFQGLLADYYATIGGKNAILRRRYLSRITEYLCSDYQNALIINSGAAGYEALTLSGIIDYLPGANKKRSDEEDELVQELLFSLDLGIDDRDLYAYRNQNWKNVVREIKNASSHLAA